MADEAAQARAASKRIRGLNLPKAVFPIYLTTFVDMLGFTLLIPLLPAIAVKYGAGDWLVGMLLSIPALCAAIAAPVWGKISDRSGRKFIILVAQGFTLAGYLLLALAPSFFWVFASRIVSGTGAGALGAAQSYIADVTSDDQRDRAYAMYGAVFGAAFIVGPVAAGFLERYGIQFPFFVATLVELANIGLTLWLLPPMAGRSRHITSVKASISAAALPGVRMVLVRQFLFIFAVIYLLADFGLYLNNALHQDVAKVSWLLAGAGVAGALTLLIVVTPLAKRIGDFLVGQIGFGLLFAAYALIFFVRSVEWFFPVLIVWAAGAAMVEPTLVTLLSKRAPKSERGAIMGLSDSVNSIAMIGAPAIGTAIAGAAAHLVGILPAMAVAGAWLLGRFCGHAVESPEGAARQ